MNTYAGNISDNKDNQLIYHMKTNKPIFNITNKHILYTELLPTAEQINKLTNEHITIIYTPNIDTAIIRHKTTRFTTTRTKALWSIAYNQPASVTFNYYDFNINYPVSIHNIQHLLSTHNTPVKLNDLTINYQLTIDPCASGSETHIPDLNFQLYNETLYPYYRALRQAQNIQHQLSFKHPKTFDPAIIGFVQTWAPAYDIDLPTPPNDSLYNFYDLQIYNNTMLNLYNQIKTYIRYQLEISDSHIICNHCNKPYHINLDFCPYCDTPIDDEIYLHLD